MLEKRSVSIWRIYFQKPTRDRWDILDSNFSWCQHITSGRKRLWMKQGEESVLLIMNAESASKTWIQVVFWKVVSGSKGKWPQKWKLWKRKKKPIYFSVLNFYLRIEREKKSISWSSCIPHRCRFSHGAWTQLPYISGCVYISPAWLGSDQASDSTMSKKTWKILVHAWDKTLSVPGKLKPTHN